MNFIEIGDGPAPRVIFAHGWGRDHRDFIPAAEALGAQTKSVLVDFPGFGKTPRPEGSWTTADYATHLAAFIRERADGKVVLAGHSFGGRVGLRLAVQNPELLAGLVLVASAGIPRQRPLHQRIMSRFRRVPFRTLRWLARSPERIDALERRFGSADYVMSRERGFRDIFLKVVNEDQSEALGRIKTPTVLLYGENDRETPPELGKRMASLIPDARFLALPEFDHNSILVRGHHIIALRVKEMLAGDS